MNLTALPDWLTSEKYLTFATWGLVGVTFLLVVATLLLLIDSRLKSNEQRRRWEKENKEHERERNDQRERWNREDEIRRTQRALDYRFGVKPDDTDVIIWVANLGITSFLVTRIWLDIVNPFDSTKRLLRKKGLEWNAVLAAGETREFRMPEGYLAGSPVEPEGNGHGYHQCEISIEIDHLGQHVKSPIKTFNVSVGEEGRTEMFLKPFSE
jgi:hypothetical protein